MKQMYLIRCSTDYQCDLEMNQDCSTKNRGGQKLSTEEFVGQVFTRNSVLLLVGRESE